MRGAVVSFGGCLSGDTAAFGRAVVPGPEGEAPDLPSEGSERWISVLAMAFSQWRLLTKGATTGRSSVRREVSAAVAGSIGPLAEQHVGERPIEHFVRRLFGFMHVCQLAVEREVSETVDDGPCGEQGGPGRRVQRIVGGK